MAATPQSRRRRRAGAADRGRTRDRRLRAPRSRGPRLRVWAETDGRGRADGPRASRGRRRARPDAARRSGLEMLATLHAAKPELPVMVLTARGEVEDRVAGLDRGAVDYLVKPFSLAELAARIRAHLRSARSAPHTARGRRRRARPAEPQSPPAGKPIALSSTEFELLAHLMRNRGRVREARGDPERGVGLPARSRHEHRRRLHRLPAPQAAPPRQPRADLRRCALSATASAVRTPRRSLPLEPALAPCRLGRCWSSSSPRR